jgi:hypothetical protein
MIELGQQISTTSHRRTCHTYGPAEFTPSQVIPVESKSQILTEAVKRQIDNIKERLRSMRPDQHEFPDTLRTLELPKRDKTTN